MNEIWTNDCRSNTDVVLGEGLKFFETYRGFNKINSGSMLACVIAPALNEEGEVEGLLNSIHSQITTHPVVVVVSDNFSSDKTAQVAISHGANVVLESKKGIGPARQKGLDVLRLIPALNQEEVIVFQTDSDSQMANNRYIQNVCQIYEHDPYIVATVGPTHYPVVNEDGIYTNLTNASDFRSCFGTSTLRELFGECGRDIDHYLLTPPYRLLIGANSTYRLSVFDRFRISYPMDKSWESLVVSVRLQQNVKSSQIAYVKDQIVVTSNRAFADDDGITTKSILKDIKRQRYIKPSKSDDSISPINTLRNLITVMSRLRYIGNTLSLE